MDERNGAAADGFSTWRSAARSARQDDSLPVEYCHVVLTLPARVADIFAHVDQRIG
jgi:hypothetical protein